MLNQAGSYLYERGRYTYAEPSMSGRWRSGKRPLARSTKTWRHPWKTMQSCYERQAVWRKPQLWNLARVQFALRVPD